MRDILRKAKPQRLEDLIALNALYRPGPLRSGMVDDFIARKQGKTEVKYELPQLEPILAETYGVIAYQEQVMRISNVVAGFTLGEADLLRKAMGKKNAEVMAKMRGKFVDGAKKLGTPEKKAAHLFDLMEHFAGYGFNKSHSTAYAFLAYQTAYLKANYPWHFAAALLTIEAQNTDKLALYLGECRERGIPVLPPDINESQLRFTVEPDGRPLRPDGDQERRRGRDRVAADGPPREGAASRRSTRSARISISGCSTSACSRAWRRPARSTRWPAAVTGHAARGAAAPGGGRRRRVRVRRAPAARQERRPGAAVRRGETKTTARGRGWPPARGAAVDRERAARVREGNPRLVLERPSGRSLRDELKEFGARSTGELAEAPTDRARRRVGPGRAASPSSPTRASAASWPRAGR